VGASDVSFLSIVHASLLLQVAKDATKGDSTQACQTALTELTELGITRGEAFKKCDARLQELL
jgi:hypothetical protein